MGRKRVVITGVGVLACNGIGREAYWNAIANGKSGIGRLDRFDASEFSCQIGGQLWDFNAEDFMKRTTVRNWHRHVHQAVASSKLAVEDAELASANYDPDRVAVGVGTSIGSPDEGYISYMNAYETGGYKKVSRLASSAFSGHSATVHVTIDLGFRGPAITISSGCATGLDALAWGVSQITSGRVDAAVVGATESPLFPLSLATACSLGILSKRNNEPGLAMRPYDSGRDGIVLSEGAVAVVLERLDHAQARGARIFAEVSGVSSAADASSPLVLDPEGKGLARAVNNALADAAVQPSQVDYIQAHGVSLEMYDRAETAAYKRVFGDNIYRIPISAVKSMTGQAYAAGGLQGLAAALMPLTTGVVSPTINLEHPDPVCDLDYVPRTARVNDVSTAVCVAISFGGTYSAAVLQRPN